MLWKNNMFVEQLYRIFICSSSSKTQYIPLALALLLRGLLGGPLGLPHRWGFTIQQGAGEKLVALVAGPQLGA